MHLKSILILKKKKKKDLDSRPRQVIVVCSWTRHFPLLMPLFTQLEYKWVPC